MMPRASATPSTSGSRRTLERSAPQEGDLGLAGVRAASRSRSAVRSGPKTQTTAQSGVGESGRAERTVDNAFPKHQVEQVSSRATAPRASDASFRAVVGDVQRRLSAVPYTKAFESPYEPGNAGQISATGIRPCFASRSPATRTRPRTGSARR